MPARSFRSREVSSAMMAVASTSFAACGAPREAARRRRRCTARKQKGEEKAQSCAERCRKASAWAGNRPADAPALPFPCGARRATRTASSGLRSATEPAQPCPRPTPAPSAARAAYALRPGKAQTAAGCCQAPVAAAATPREAEGSALAQQERRAASALLAVSSRSTRRCRSSASRHLSFHTAFSLSSSFATSVWFSCARGRGRGRASRPTPAPASSAARLCETGARLENCGHICP